MRRSPSRRASARRSRPAVDRLTIRAQRHGGALTHIEVTGHAGFAAAGSDIVCAAVSALVMTAANGVARVCGAPVRISDDPAGAFVLDVPGGGGACAQSVLESTMAGLRAIAQTYPDHVRVSVSVTGARLRSAKKGRPRKGA